MKSPFRKLRDFALSKHGFKEKVSSELEEDTYPDVAKCMQDVEGMRAEYEGLLTNGQIVSGAAYDFSRALQDMASYMMETFGEIVDGEIGNMFSMLAKVQFEMSKLLDLFAAHVSQSIITPTERMMTKIQQVEVIREQYDEKRQLYNLLQMEKQKGKLKKGKGNQSYLTKEDIKQQANSLKFRMQLLMQEQSQSLLTQAARYHTAQMHLFSKGLASINAVEPVMRQLAQERNIDRFLLDEELPNNGNLEIMEMDGEGEAPKNDGETDSMASSPRHLLEPLSYSSESSKELKFVPKKAGGNSKSAPISPSMYYKKEGDVNVQEMLLESEHEIAFMYALPSPLDARGRWVDHTTGTISSQTHTNQGFGSHPQPMKGYYSGNVLDAYKSDHNTKASYDVGSRNQYTHTMDHFVPMQQHANHQGKASTNGKFTTFVGLTKNDDLNSLPAEKGRRYSQSGPLTHNPLANSSRCATASNASSMAVCEDHVSPLYKSGPVGRSPMSSYTTRTPPSMSPPQISELHKLPLPPQGSIIPLKSPSPIAYSAPLGRKVQEVPFTSGPASPLPPPPPGLVPRSLSIPSSANHMQELQNGADN